MKSLIIVESPGKVKKIQEVVGDKYLVMSSKGHINELSKGKSGIGINPLKEFRTYYSLLPDKFTFIDTIVAQNDELDQIIICSDEDVEGHAIAWHIASYLKSLNKPIRRAVFHEITKTGIQEGLKNICDLDYNKFKAQETRRVLDRIVGFMVSPFLINFYGKNLSAGRVQSVAARMIIEREEEVVKFKPEEYWNITAQLTKQGQVFNAKYQGKVKNKKQAEKIKFELEKPSIKDAKFKVISVNKKLKKDYAPPALNTAKMQQLMASKHGIEGEQTMAAAQFLYEHGLISYHRTDSVRASDTALDMVRSWLKDQGLEIPAKPNVFKNKDAAQDAHECIRPTDITKTPKSMNLQTDAQILYRMIWNYFTASQMMPAVFATLTAKVKHDSSDHIFTISGKLLNDPGYLYLLDGRSKSNGSLPTIDKDEYLHLKDNNAVELEQKFTQPPSRYTYASLVKELEQKGVGRPSTFAAISSTILNRGYVIKDGDTYKATELGSRINKILTKYFDFIEYDYTAHLEKQMDEIAVGKMNYNQVLSEFFEDFKIKLGKAHIDNGGRVCDKCGSPMYLRDGKYSKFWNCALFPFCSATHSLKEVA